MSRPILNLFYGLAMIALIIGIDLAFFKGRFWARLLVNIAIVLVFATLFLLFLRRP